MLERPRMPNLALPFAVVGLAAGWLSDGFLANPLVGAITHDNRLTAAIVAALAGAALGAILTRHAATRNALGATNLGFWSFAGLVTLAGLGTGGVVGGLETGTMWGALSGSVNGAVSGIGFIPVCAAVVTYARRADRARHGSIVAAADHRAVWGVLATGLAVMTLLGALEIPAAFERMRGPRIDVYFGFALAIVCGLAILAFVIADAFAFARVRTVASADLEQRDPSEARYVTDVPAVDLGLGDDVAAKMERAKSAYRGKDRALGLLWGSVSAARRALAFSMARGVLGLAVVAAVLAGHRFSTTPAARVEYQAQRCKSSIPSCYTAASLLQSEPGITPDPVRAEALLRRGCEAGEKRACDALYRSSLSGSLPYWYVPSP